MRRWVCYYCGQVGRLKPGEHLDEVQCDICGEPVWPLD
jgi:hypothetical protein